MKIQCRDGKGLQGESLSIGSKKYNYIRITLHAVETCLIWNFLDRFQFDTFISNKNKAELEMPNVKMVSEKRKSVYTGFKNKGKQIL